MSTLLLIFALISTPAPVSVLAKAQPVVMAPSSSQLLHCLGMLAGAPGNTDLIVETYGKLAASLPIEVQQALAVDPLTIPSVGSGALENNQVSALRQIVRDFILTLDTEKQLAAIAKIKAALLVSIPGHSKNSQTKPISRNLSMGKLSGTPVFSPDRKFILTYTTKPQKLELHEVDGYKKIRTYQDPQGEGLYSNMSFSPDGKLIAAYFRSRFLVVFNTASGETVFKMEYSDQIKQIAFSSDDSKLFVVGSNGLTRINLNPQQINSFSNESPQSLSVVPTTYGDLLVINRGAGRVEVMTGHAIPLVTHFTGPMSVSADSSELRLAYKISENKYAISTLRLNSNPWEFKKSTALTNPAILASAAPVYAIRSDDQITVQTIGSDAQAVLPVPSGDIFREVELSPDGKWALVSAKNAGAILWNVLTQETYPLYLARFRGTHWSPDSSAFAIYEMGVWKLYRPDAFLNDHKIVGGAINGGENP